MKNKTCGECKYHVYGTCRLPENGMGILEEEKACRFFTQKTNRDVINAMTDEELAKWKCKFPDRHDRNGHCRIYWLNPQRCRPELNCRQCLTEWLKAPAGKHQEI